MMSSLCSHTLSCSPSPNYWHWVLKPPRMPFSLHRSLRVTASPPTFLNHKWRSECFRNGDSSYSDASKSEFVEEKLQEEFTEPEFDHSTVLRNDTVSSLQKGTHALFSSGSWTVPWTGKTMLQDMLLWIASFWLVGSWVIPLIAHTAGFGKKSLTYRGQALYRLLTDMAEGLIGIAIRCLCLSMFHPLPSDWFGFSLNGKWQFDSLWAALHFHWSTCSHRST